MLNVIYLLMKEETVIQLFKNCSTYKNELSINIMRISLTKCIKQVYNNSITEVADIQIFLLR